MIVTPALADSTAKTITAAGNERAVINEGFFNTYRFQPDHPIFVHTGDTIILTDTSNDVHTLSLVDRSLLPTNTSGVLSCGPSASPSCQGTLQMDLHPPTRI